jgi:hypothetical protein
MIVGIIHMRNRWLKIIRVSGFILIIVGTIGLLLNEFVFETSSSRAIIFSTINFVGLINLAFSFLGMNTN